MNTMLRILGVGLAAVFWMIAGAVALIGVSIVFAVMGIFIPFLHYPAPFMALFALLIGAKALNRVRRARAASVLSYTEQAVRLNLPVPAMLDAAAASESMGSARTLRHVAAAIRMGIPIDEAVARYVGAISGRSVELLRGAASIGRLPTMLSGVAEEHRADERRGPTDDMLMWGYGLVVVTVMLWLLGRISILILPKFVEIFRDFDTTLPWATQVTFEFGRTAGYIVAPLAVLLGLSLAGWSVWALVLGGHRRHRPLRVLYDPLIWTLPVFGGIARDRGMADVCGLIVEAMRAGQPLNHAADAATRLDMNTVLKRRVQRFAGALDEGMPAGDAARRAKLPRLTVQLLAKGQHTSGTLEVMRFLHRYYHTRFSRLRELARGAAVPAMVLVLGLVVGWVVVSLFLPLTTLMYSANTFYEPGVF